MVKLPYRMNRGCVWSVVDLYIPIYISVLIDQSVPDVLLAVKLRFGVLEELV